MPFFTFLLKKKCALEYKAHFKLQFKTTQPDFKIIVLDLSLREIYTLIFKFLIIWKNFHVKEFRIFMKGFHVYKVSISLSWEQSCK